MKDRVKFHPKRADQENGGELDFVVPAFEPILPAFPLLVGYVDALTMDKEDQAVNINNQRRRPRDSPGNRIV
jgi:hypothetical protein